MGGDAGSFGGFDSTPSGLAGAPDSDGDAEGLFETPGESGLNLAAADPDPTEAGEMDLGAGGDPIGADEHPLTQESAESVPDRGAFDMPDSDDGPDAPDVQSPSTQPTPPPQSTALGQVGVVRVPASEVGRSQRAPVEAEPEMTPAQRWLRRGVGAVGGSVVAALIGVAVLGGLLRGPARADDAAYQLRVGALSAEDVAGHWVENASTGSIYIVSGVLRNPTGQLAVADGVIRARLVDAVGNPVYAESAVAGPSPSIERLREAALADLRQLQEAGAARMAHFALAPGSGLPFTAVFADVPTEATGFRLDVEPVSATPAPGFSGS